MRGALALPAWVLPSAATATTVPVTRKVPATPAAMLSCRGLLARKGAEALDTRRATVLGQASVLSHAYEVSCRVRAGECPADRSGPVRLHPKDP